MIPVDAFECNSGIIANRLSNCMSVASVLWPICECPVDHMKPKEKQPRSKLGKGTSHFAEYVLFASKHYSAKISCHKPYSVRKQVFWMRKILVSMVTGHAQGVGVQL